MAKKGDRGAVGPNDIVRIALGEGQAVKPGAPCRSSTWRSWARRGRAGLGAGARRCAGVVRWGKAQGTWVRLRRLDASDYAENGVAALDGDAPVFVTGTARRLPVGKALHAEVAG